MAGGKTKKPWPESVVAHALAVADMTGGARTAHRALPEIPVRTIQSWRAAERRAPQSKEAKDTRGKLVEQHRERLFKVWSESTYAALEQLSARLREGSLSDATLLATANYGTDKMVGLLRAFAIASVDDASLSLADLYRRALPVVTVTSVDTAADGNVGE